MRWSVVAGVLLVVAGFLSWFTWRQLHPPTTVLRTSGLPLRVSHAAQPGQFWVDLAERQGWFQEAGLTVELTEPRPEDAPFARLASGAVDAEPGSLFELIRARAQDADLVLVVLCAQSFGADGLVSREDIDSIQSLRGKRIGVARGTQAEFLLSVALQRRGLRLQDVTVVDLQGQALVDAFAYGDVEALAASEPLLSDALRRAAGRRLFDTSQLPGVIAQGYAVKRELIERRPADVQAFVNVWHRTATFLRERPEEAFAMLAETYQKKPGALEASCQRFTLLGLRDNLTAFAYATGFESLHGAARQIHTFLMQQGLADQEIDSTEFLDAQFIRTLRL